MNTRLIRREAVWALLVMECGLALPIMSTTTQGEGDARLGLTVLALLLLPAGYVGVQLVGALRDPAWRVLAGFALVVVWRSQATQPTGDGPAFALARFLQIVVPAAMAFALWWRGGSLADAELTFQEVRLEFLVTGGALLMLLVVFHGVVAGDPALLAWAVGLFSAGGLLSTVLARQDGADLDTPGSGRLLAVACGLVPIGATVLLLVALRPNVLDVFWRGLGRLIELALTPIGLFFAWLASLLPRREGNVEQPLPPRPPEVLPTDIRSLVEGQALPEWVAWATLTLVLLLVLLLVGGALRILLDSQMHTRAKQAERRDPGLTVEHAGNAQDDMRELLGWVMRWLRGRLRRGPAADGSAAGRELEAWAAYRALLLWAERNGVSRRPTETTGELETRLRERVPEAADVVGLVTESFESERYGDTPVSEQRLRTLQHALAELDDGRRGST